MPIALLTDIKFSGELPLDFSGGLDLLDQEPGQVFRAYVLSCKELNADQSLFNDGVPSVIFMPNLPDEAHLSKGGKAVRLKSVWVCCGVIKDTQWHIPDDLDYILVLRFRPSSFYSIFQVNPSVFDVQPIRNFDELVDESWVHVVEEMYQQDHFAEKIAIIKGALETSKKSTYLPPLLQTAIDHIEQRKGNTSVAELLTVIGCNINQKWLQRNFTKYIGLSPKRYISLQRFVYTYGQCHAGKSSDLLDVAVSSGYYDYNHFLKDFKQYMGVVPSRYRWR